MAWVLLGCCYVVWVVAGALLCGVGVAMWFGWLVGHCYVAWVLLGCCYVVWVVGGALLCGLGGW